MTVVLIICAVALAAAIGCAVFAVVLRRRVIEAPENRRYNLEAHRQVEAELDRGRIEAHNWHQ